MLFRSPTASTTDSARRVRPAVALAGALAIAGLSVLGTWASLRRPGETGPSPVRFTILPPASKPTGHNLSLSGADDLIALSPDGQSLVYVASVGAPIVGGPSQLMVRRFNQTEPTLIPNLGQPRSPFISPDGRWIGYFDGQTALKKVSIDGGAPVTICPNLAPAR